MKDLQNYVKMMDALDKVYVRLPSKAGTVAVNFSKERFRRQNWVDRTRHPWPERKTKRKGRRNNGKLLVDTGRLRRSIRKIHADRHRAIVGTDVEYARIHNDGGRIDKIEQVKTYRVRQHSRKRNGRRETVKSHLVHSHVRNMHMKMPQRQFIGESAVMGRRIERMMQKEIVNAIRASQ